MSDDCASARLFMRTVEAFIVDVLGVDPKTNISREKGGLFGRTKAYFGIVETQGRGALNIHFLIWIFGAPINTQDFEEKNARSENDFKKRMEAYTESIVTNSVPLPVEEYQCISCNTVGTISSLPIPPAIHKQDRKSSNSTKKGSKRACSCRVRVVWSPIKFPTCAEAAPATERAKKLAYNRQTTFT